MANREDVCHALAAAAEDYPHLRIGQVLLNALEAANISAPLYYITDAELLAALDAYEPEATNG